MCIRDRPAAHHGRPVPGQAGPGRPAVHPLLCPARHGQSYHRSVSRPAGARALRKRGHHAAG
eukprot:3380732-Lingulodinium_polyedra.AAC.1